MLKRISVVTLMWALGASSQGWAQAQVVADSGFRPKPHGFSFENWGGKQHPQGLLTPDDAAFLFGDQACARKEGDACVPTPGAKLWIDQINKSSEGGHCEGLAALSAAFYVKQEKVDEFGASQAFALKPDDEWLMRTISTYFATQFLEPVQSSYNATKKWPLQQIVDYLAKNLKAGEDYPTLGIYSDSGGHAITPYKIELTAPKQYRIYIYDNNYPGAERFIDVDVAKNSWVYTGAALNPKEAASAWKGSAGSMDVTLLSTRYEPLKCPFCGAPPPKPTAPKPPKPQASGPKPKSPKAPAPGSKPKPKPKPPQAAAPKPKKPAAGPVGKPKPASTPPRPAAQPSQNWTVYTPSRCSQVQATGKKSQQQVRMGATGVDSQVAGASMQPMRGTRGCVVQLPRDQEYDVKLVDDGKPSSQPFTALTVFSPGQVYSVSNVAIRPNATETVSFGGSNFNYQAGSKQKPTVQVADENYGGDGYYEVSDFEINEGHNFTAEEDEDGRIAFSDDDPELDDYDIDVEVIGDDETEYYAFEDVSTGDDGEVLMDIDDEGEFDLDVDSDGDGEGNYYDEDDDNDGSDDAADTDDDNDGVGDETDDNYAGEEDYEYDDSEADAEDEASDDGEDESADDASDEGEDEGADDASDEGEDEGADDDSDDGEGEGADDDSDDGEDEGADEGSDDAEDDASDDGEDLDEGSKSAMMDDEAEDESVDESEDEATDEAEDEGADEAEDEAAYEAEDEGVDESEDEAAYEAEDESVDESEDEAAYEAEDEAAYESEDEDAGYAEDESYEDE